MCVCRVEVGALTLALSHESAQEAAKKGTLGEAAREIEQVNLTTLNTPHNSHPTREIEQVNLNPKLSARRRVRSAAKP